MFDSVKRLNDSDFGAQLSVFLQSAKSLWGTGAGLVVQATLHYYEHRHDCSRLEQLWTVFDDAGQQGMTTALHEFMQKATGVTRNLKGDAWKGKGRPVPDDEVWQGLVQGLIDGEGAAFMSYRGKKAEGKKKGAKKSPKVGTPNNFTEAAANAATKALDGLSAKGMSETQIIKALENLGTSASASPLDAFQYESSREAAKDILEALVREEKAIGPEAVEGFRDMALKKIQNHIDMQIAKLKEAAEAA